ncbi:MAG: DUF4157 domain-containing protein, partial [Proteobacteria bacterium]|nr:DUF4157 domain-containing protein [Pseudomonadota bacterium]
MFEDNRPEAVAQMKLQKLADHSPQSRQAAQYHKMANSSPQVQLLSGMQEAVDNSPTMIGGEKSETKTALPSRLKTGIENLSSLSLDDVQVHYNSPKPAQLHALAYTQGTEIHVGPGQEGHLPHEAWHVVQQKQGRVRPGIQVKGLAINNDRALEREADVFGKKALSVHGQRSAAPVTRPFRTPTGQAPVQAKFGFEAELAVALGWASEDNTRLPKNRYSKPDDKVTSFPKAATGIGFDIHIDHNSSVKDIVNDSTSIVELVTRPPIDESTTTEQDVRARMKQMQDFVRSANDRTLGLSHRSKLSDLTNVGALNVPRGHLFVGGEKKGDQQLDAGYLQETFAVKFEKAPQVMQDFSDRSRAFDPLVRANLASAAEHTSSPFEIIETIKLPEKFEWLEHGKLKTPWGDEMNERESHALIHADMMPLMGLLGLMLNYLSLGKFVPKHTTNRLLKNHLGTLFVKSRLSSVRNRLTGASQWCTEDKSSRMYLAAWLLTTAKRNPGEPVVAVFGDSVTVDAWVLAVLEGSGDPLFDQAKNRYSDEIKPYDVGNAGGSPGVPIENRNVAPKGGYTYPNPQALWPVESRTHRPVEDWGDIAVNLWNYLRQVNDIV